MRIVRKKEGLPNNGILTAGDDHQGEVFITNEKGVVTQISPKKAAAKVLPVRTELTQPIFMPQYAYFLTGCESNTNEHK